MKDKDVMLIAGIAGGAFLLWPSIKKGLGQMSMPSLSAPIPVGNGHSDVVQATEARSGHTGRVYDSQPIKHEVELSVRDRSGRPIRGTATPVFASNTSGGGKIIATPSTYTAVTPKFAQKMKEAGLIE